MRNETLAAKVSLSEARRWIHGAHRAVNDQDARFER